MKEKPWLMVALIALPLLVLVLILDRLPRPVGVHELSTQVAPDLVEIAPGEPVEIHFTIPSGRNVHALSLNLRNIGEFGPVDVRLTRGGEELASHRIVKDAPHILPLGPGVELRDGEDLVLRVERAELQPPVVGSLPRERFPARLKTDHERLPLIGFGYGEGEAGWLAEPLPEGSDEVQPLPIRENEPIQFEFVAPEADLNQIRFPVQFPDDHTRVRVFIRNLTGDREIATQVYRPGNPGELQHFDPANAAGDRIQVRIERATSHNPEWRTAIYEPPGEFQAFRGGKSIPEWPMFLPLFHFPWLGVTLWSWLAVGVAFLAALRWKSLTWVFFPVLAIVATAWGYQLWLHLLTVYEHFRDPDSYGWYGNMLYRWITEPAARPNVAAQLGKFPHAQTGTIPSILALLQLAGMEQSAAYVFLSALSSSLIAFCIYWMLHRQLGVSHLVSLCGVIAFALGISVTRAWARPSTDMPGVLLLVLTWPILIERVKQKRLWHLVALVVLMILIAMSRPPGPVYLLWIGGMILVVDLMRERKLNLPARIRTGLSFTIPVVAVLTLLFGTFHWMDNVRTNIEETRTPAGIYDWTDYLRILAMKLQILPIFWLFIREKDTSRQAALWIGGSWLLFYLIMMVAVGGAVVHRLYLPIMPAAIILTCFGWERLVRWKGWLAGGVVALVLAHAGVNLAMMVYQITLDHYPRALYLPN